MDGIKKYRGQAMKDKIDAAERAAVGAAKKKAKPKKKKKSVRESVDDNFWG